jgi:hypothetical protein
MIEQSVELDALFARLPQLDLGELLALGGAHRAFDAAREEAWRTVRDVVSTEHMERDLDALRSDVGAWATRLALIVGDEAGTPIDGLLMTEARRGAASAVLDAAVAHLLGPRLPVRDREALLRAWRDVIAASPSRRRDHAGSTRRRARR